MNMLDAKNKSVDFEIILGKCTTNRKKLFQKALSCAHNGKVLYILQEELSVLPELSQDLNSVNRYYMKMISFLYVKTIDSLIETLLSLTEWHSIPNTIILDTLNGYCGKRNLVKACGIVALLLDTIHSCSKCLNTLCHLYITIDRQAGGPDYFNLLQEMYGLKL